MKLENSPPESPQAAALAKSGSAVETAPAATPGVAECPIKKHEEPKKPPLRLLLWNIQELGGGFYRPHKREQYVIDAYAAVIKALEIDILVILGVTDTIGVIPEETESGDRLHVKFDETLRDTGPAEVARIAKLLGGGWQTVWPQPQHLYHYRTTTAILFNSASGLSLAASGLAECALDLDIGLTGRLFCASFDAAKYTEKKVFVAVPLGTSVPARPYAVPPKPAKESDLAVTLEFPETSILGISGQGDLAASSAFSGFKAEVDAAYRPPAKEGTFLKDSWWFPRADGDDGVLENFAAVDPGNSILQDDEMHWEALETPTHARDLGKVTGALTDSWLLRHTAEDPSPIVEELRVADLIAAAMKTAVLAKARPVKPEHSQEDSAMTAQRDQYRKSLGKDLWVDGLDNEISDCAHFTRVLTEHWPVLMQIRFIK